MTVQSYIENFCQKLGVEGLTFEEKCEMFYFDEDTNSMKFNWELWF